MSRVKIIAEAGVNHNGNIIIAKKMIDFAKEAGADYIKFQTFIPENLVSKHAKKAEYQKITTVSDESQLQMLRKLMLSENEFIELSDYCEATSIGFISTPFDLESVDFLNSFNMDFWKVPSGEITNLPYLVEIAKTGKPIILSTGMSNLDEIDAALSVLHSNGAGKITLLHCNTQYPTPMEDVNLNAMLTLKDRYNCDVGYSDHTLGIEVPIAAVALGATVIEKHFTLDHNMEGPDHKASLEPCELKSMVSAIRNIEKALGTGSKVASPSEIENKDIARKSIVASRMIKKGEVFSKENITTKRPGSGISPMKWYNVIGAVAKRDFQEDELIEL